MCNSWHGVEAVENQRGAVIFEGVSWEGTFERDLEGSLCPCFIEYDFSRLYGYLDFSSPFF